MELRTATISSPPKHAEYGKISAERAAVLIVEDEAIIRMNAVDIVEDAGYIALEASNANDALVILRSRRDIAAVFTDVVISGSRSGLRLAHAISRRWPPIHLIVTSGLALQSEVPPGARFVRKPYENPHVVALLHELFDGT